MKKTLFILSLLFLIVVSCSEEQDRINTNEPDPDSLFSDTRIINDVYEGEEIAVLANSRSKYMIAFSRRMEDGAILNFEPKRFSLPIVMTDNEGNSWDLMGNALEGPRQGSKLEMLEGSMGFWLAWSSMFPKVATMEESDEEVALEGLEYNEDWDIPVSHIHRGCAIDGIVSIDQPKFTTYDSRDYVLEDFYVQDDDLLVLTKFNGKWRAYPIKILNWHEIVNDEVNGESFTVSYCPLSGSSNVIRSVVNGRDTEFGVSGLLYNSNLILYDRNTGSLWQQMQFRCISGDQKGAQLEVLPSLEISWAVLKGMDIPVEILTTETGFKINYDEYPYGNYPDNLDVVTSRIYEDDRYPIKERVYGVNINNKTKVYRFEDFLE